MELQKEHNNSTDNTRRARSFPFMLNRKIYLWVVALFTVVGVTGGYVYYALVGCTTGGCAITSNPYMSMAWGGILGYLLPDFFVKKQKGNGP